MPVNDDPYHVFGRDSAKPGHRAVCLEDGTILATMPCRTPEEKTLYLRHFDVLERVVKQGILDVDMNRSRTYSVVRGLTPEREQKPCYHTRCDDDGFALTWHAVSVRGLFEARRWLKIIRNAYETAVEMEQRAQQRQSAAPAL